MAEKLFGFCAKARVQAVLVGASGKVYVGENVCLNPQEVCPREPGEGYDKCQSVCMQLHHAEIQALDQAGADAFGGSLVVGYYYCCEACRSALAAAGVATVTLKP